jgi:hypothetical protein
MAVAFAMDLSSRNTTQKLNLCISQISGMNARSDFVSFMCWLALFIFIFFYLLALKVISHLQMSRQPALRQGDLARA